MDESIQLHTIKAMGVFSVIHAMECQGSYKTEYIVTFYPFSCVALNFEWSYALLVVSTQGKDTYLTSAKQNDSERQICLGHTVY